MKRLIFLTLLFCFVLAVDAADQKPHEEAPIKKIVFAPGRYFKHLMHEVGVVISFMTVKR